MNPLKDIMPYCGTGTSGEDASNTHQEHASETQTVGGLLSPFK